MERPSGGSRSAPLDSARRRESAPAAYGKTLVAHFENLAFPAGSHLCLLLLRGLELTNLALLSCAGLWACAAEEDPASPGVDAGVSTDAAFDADALPPGDDAGIDGAALPDLPEETCNGEDDDDDGAVDEDDPGGGFFCLTQMPGICGIGRTACVDGNVECRATTEAGIEDCANFGRDDDCNGVVDDVEG